MVIGMTYLIMRREGNIDGFIKAWELITSRLVEGKRLISRKKIRKITVGEVITNSINTVKASTSYTSIPVVTSSRYVDLHYYVKNWICLTKLKKILGEYKISASLVTPSVLAAIAQGYLLAIRTNRFGITRTFLGDYLVNIGLLEHRDITELALNYLILSLYVPSRTQLMYVLMKISNSTDPEDITNSLRSLLFTGRLVGIKKLALTTYLELEETGYFEKYFSRKTLVTPTHFAYVFAQLLDKLIDFDTFRKTYVYITRGGGLVTVPAFKELFEKTIVDEHVLDVVGSKPVGKAIVGVLKELARNYEQIYRETIKIVQI